MISHNNSSPPYLLKPNQEKAFHDYEGERVLRDIWKEVYTEQERDDNREIEEVRHYPANTIHRTTPHHTGDNKQTQHRQLPYV